MKRPKFTKDELAEGVTVYKGDCRKVLKTLPADSVHCVVTSPPYWGLRDYGIPPTVWGGDAKCDHVWGKPQRTANANSVPGPNTGGKNDNGHRNETKWTGPFCQHCGHWTPPISSRQS